MQKEFIVDENNLDQVCKYIFSIWNKESILLLKGEIGAGKTTLVKQIGKELGIKEVITSPTFTIMKKYPNLIHIDAYRISGSIEDLEDEFDNNYVIIEWPEKIQYNFINPIEVNIQIENNKRRYIISNER